MMVQEVLEVGFELNQWMYVVLLVKGTTLNCFTQEMLFFCVEMCSLCLFLAFGALFYVAIGILEVGFWLDHGFYFMCWEK